jgi:CMP/dCMP kinase
MCCSAKDHRVAPSPIAIDGTAASGKSTLGAALARRYGFVLFDTGVTYRAFTLAAIEAGIPATDIERCTSLARELDVRIAGSESTRIWVNGEEVTHRLREPAVEAAVSDYSAIAGVREVMVRVQRDVAAASPSVVVGRDIGTVVLPQAPVKFFLVASDEVRAQRRSAQAGEWGQQQDLSAASGDIGRRDGIDSTRGALREPEDAVRIDTTTLTPEEVLEQAIEVIECGA